MSFHRGEYAANRLEKGMWPRRKSEERRAWKKRILHCRENNAFVRMAVETLRRPSEPSYPFLKMANDFDSIGCWG